MDEMLIDYSEKIVAIAGHRMEFTKIEYQIIEFLSMHPGQVFDKERIDVYKRQAFVFIRVLRRIELQFHIR